MKKEIVSKSVTVEKTVAKTKAKSLRPMRSMVSVKSLKPKTLVAGVMVKETEVR